MFDKLKQLNELRKMKNAIQAETVTAERNGVKITINGSFNVEDLSVSPEAKQGSGLEKDLRACFNDAVGKIQATLAQKFSSMMQ
ncbi:MAG: YbaB/EbfC family nucleoid-associated protein [Candidatus Paceibacter sp.]|nr:YbaB/EbfC family nucleoid-associated protein [Candidatus Paceibacter sp.]